LPRHTTQTVNDTPQKPINFTRRLSSNNTTNVIQNHTLLVF